MRTTLNLKDDLYHEAVKATGVEEKTKLIHMGLQALLREAAAKRLAGFYGKVQKASVAPRRRFQWS